MTSTSVYPCNPKIHIDATQLPSEILDNADVTTWNGFTALDVGGAGLPKLRTNEKYRYVRFGTLDASAIKGNYLNFGSQTWNLQHGFTAIGVIRFYAAKTWQRWFDFGTQAALIWSVVNNTQGSGRFILNASLNQELLNVVPNNTWTIVIAHVPSSTEINTWYNPTTTLSSKNTTTGSISFPENGIGITNNWIARSNYSSDSYACLDIRESLFYDRALSISELQNMIAFLRTKYSIDPYLPKTGSLTATSIRNLIQPGFSNLNLGNLYRGGLYNSVISSLSGIPATGPITFSNFYGAGWLSNPSNISNFYAWYTPQSWSVANNRWEDASGNLRHTIATRGSISVGTSLGIMALIGNTSAGVRFPTSVLPPTYTLFHVARYTGGSRKRIFDGLTQNWLSGFWGDKSGIAHHDEWLTQTSTSLHGDNWVISCDQNRIYRSNGIQRNTTLPTGSFKQLTINHGSSTTGETSFWNEPSDWAVAEVIVYNRTLTPHEIIRVENYLAYKYGLSI